MPAKAGMFTLIPGDISVPGVGGDLPGFHVEVGFEPNLVIVMTAGLTAENSWHTGGDNWGGMAVMTRDNEPSTSVQPATAVNEWWSSFPRPASFWSNSGVIWFRGPSSGAAMYLANTYEDGFNIGYPTGYAGNYGAICYYLALQTDFNVKRVFGYQGSPAVTLGWEPSLIFSLAHGGLSPGPNDIGMADFSIPSWGFGGYENLANPTQNGVQWMANGLTHSTSVEQVRFISDGWNDHVVYDGQTVAQMVANSAFYYSRTATTADVNYTSGFPEGDYIRAGAHLMEGGLFSGGSVTPNPVGTPLEVDTQFTPDAVIFLGPQASHEGDFGDVPWGGRCFGFLTEDFECCIAWGAYSHIGTAASFCTSNYSWISNFTSTQLNAITTPNYGNAEIGGPGFIMHTQAMPKLNKYVRYAAFGIEEDAPQFFRVIQ